MIATSEKLIEGFCETTSLRTFKQSMFNVTESYYPKYFLLKALSNCYTFALLTAGNFTFDSAGIYPQIYHRTPRPAVFTCKGV